MRGIVQECAFLGLEYLISIFGPYLPPKNVKLWPNIGNLKSKCWNVKVQVYQKELNQSTWKFNTMLET